MKINKKEFRIKSAGYKLYCVFEEPENPKNTIVILLHGLTNNHLNCPLIDNTAKSLQKTGFPTFRFDYFGSGRSEGIFMDKTWQILVQNTKDALKYVKTQLKYPKIGIWGRSLGAILGATICDDPVVTVSVLLSFTVQTRVSFSAFFPSDKTYSLPILGTAKVKGEPILNRRFYEDTNWIDRLQKRHLSNAKNILIMQGTADKTIYDPSWARDVYDLVKRPKELLYIKGADHAYRGHEKDVIKKTIQWYGRCLINNQL